MNEIAPITNTQRTYLDYRRKGLTIPEIAEVCEVTPSTVRESLYRALTRVLDQKRCDQSLELELGRFEDLTKAFYEDALNGNKDAADMVLKISDRRVKLMGLENRGKGNDGSADNLVGLLSRIAEKGGSATVSVDGTHGMAPSGRDRPEMEGETGDIREGSVRGGTGPVAEEGLLPPPEALEVSGEVGPRGGEVLRAESVGIVVSGDEVPSRGRLHGPNIASAVRHSVDEDEGVAEEGTEGFSVRVPG